MATVCAIPVGVLKTNIWTTPNIPQTKIAQPTRFRNRQLGNIRIACHNWATLKCSAPVAKQIFIIQQP